MFWPVALELSQHQSDQAVRKEAVEKQLVVSVVPGGFSQEAGAPRNGIWVFSNSVWMG